MVWIPELGIKCISSVGKQLLSWITNWPEESWSRERERGAGREPPGWSGRRVFQLCPGNPRPSSPLAPYSSFRPMQLASGLPGHPRVPEAFSKWPFSWVLFLLDTSRNVCCSLCHMVMDRGNVSGWTVPCLNTFFPFLVTRGFGVLRLSQTPLPMKPRACLSRCQ